MFLISGVSAQDNLTDACQVPAIPDSPDTPDLIANETIYVNSDNIDTYFKDNTLSSNYDNKIFIFEGEFDNLEKLTVSASNITIKGDGASLKNTVFDIESDNVTLDSLKFDLDSSFDANDGAAILFSGDNPNFNNLDINYIVPLNVEAYGFYGVGSKGSSKNLKITNSKINFEGHNNNVLDYNCAVKIINYDDSQMINNTINTHLPLKDVNHGSFGATLDSDYVLSVGVENCNNFLFENNQITTDVNYRSDTQYPTLDALMISKCDNSTIIKNSIYMVDFVTNPGVDNYLYGIDIYNLNNLTVASNTVSIITTGGKLSAGTAYPIQITGPISKVNITGNDLYSFSNGPNIGIYSQNYYGSTDLSITNNRINVTGLAGTHEWALVSGIETQDSSSYIANNTIEVHSVAPVSINDNIYGVSYRQSTAGDHKYDIHDNTVFSDGFKSVYLLTSKNSSVSNNLLVSYNDKAKNGYDGFEYQNLDYHSNINFENNQVIRAFDYFARQNNNVESNDKYTYSKPANDNHISNDIDAHSIAPSNNPSQYSYNPLIQGSDDFAYTIVLFDVSGADNSNEGDQSEGKSGSNKNNGIGKTDISSSNGGSMDFTSNSTDSTPSTEGSQPLNPDSNSAQGGEASVKKAFELEKLAENTSFIPSIGYIILAMILLIVGYRYKNSDFN